MWKRRLIWGVWFLFTVLLYFFENNLGTRTILAASVLLPAVSVFCAAISVKSVGISVSVPSQSKKNDAVNCTINIRGLLPCALFTGSFEVNNRLIGEATTLVLSVSAFSNGAISLTASHCGMVQITIADGRVQDLFGLWRSRVIPCETEYLSVQPNLFPPEVELVESAAISADGERWSMMHPGSDPSETFAIREYMPGDPVGQIHWKLSQKNETTMLREFGLPIVEQTLLLLETAIPDDGFDASAMDASVETLLSLSHSLIMSGIAHSVGWKDHSLDELELFEVRTEQEWAEMQEQLISACSMLDEESVCACFRKWCGEKVYAHTVVCAVEPPADAASLCGGNRVTLLLSGGKYYDGSLGDMQLKSYTPVSAPQELKYIEI